MFESNTLQAVAPLLAQAKVMTTVPDSLLSTLVRTLGVPGMADTQTIEEALTVVGQSAAVASQGHTEANTEAKQLVAASVRKTLDLCINVVRPHIAKVIGEFDNKMKTFTEAAVSPYKIKAHYIEDIYKDPIVNDLLVASEGMARLSPYTTSSVIGIYSREDLFRLLALSDTRNINTQLFALLTDDNNDGYNRITNMLEGRTSIAEVLKYRPNLALPLIIILRAIETPTEGVNNTLSNWEQAKLAMTNNAYSGLRDHLARLENVLKYDVLYYVGMKQEPYVINVNGEVYSRYLEKGLTANALIGNEIFKRAYKGAELLEKSAMLEEAYAKEQRLLQQAHNVKRRTFEVNAMIAALREDANTRSAENNFVVEGDSAEKVSARLRTLLESITTGPHRNDDTLMLITAVIIGTWYAHTDAQHFFDCSFEIEHGSAAGALPPNEIRTLATLRYLTRWVREQIIIKG